MLGCAETAPPSKSGGAVALEILSVVKRAFLIEMVVDRGVNGCEFLQRSHLSETKHRAFAFEKVDGNTRPECSSSGQFPICQGASYLNHRAVGSKLVSGQNHWRFVAVFEVPKRGTFGHLLRLEANRGQLQQSASDNASPDAPSVARTDTPERKITYWHRA